MDGLLSALETPSGKQEALASEALNTKFLKCFVAEKAFQTALRAVVFAALDSGVGWRKLLDWATEAGHNEQHVRKVLSAILTEAGVRTCRPGAGHQIPPEAMTLLACARSRYGLTRTGCNHGQDLGLVGYQWPDPGN